MTELSETKKRKRETGAPERSEIERGIVEIRDLSHEREAELISIRTWSPETVSGSRRHKNNKDRLEKELGGGGGGERIDGRRRGRVRGAVEQEAGEVGAWKEKPKSKAEAESRASGPRRERRRGRRRSDGARARSR
ncbi:uncharacterized protein A4U43_C04F18190 [Asparagus officinalis]|uniref:Uncharacterized protein n=1 Tax=Asparagus officinalis TaxID=4686 RepID=A0A5P1F1U1_ASPOF|nr:uncharacterized protein A4U43_C04F18190 [Asparagus officinalis]